MGTPVMPTEDELRQEMKAAARRVLDARVQAMTYNINYSLDQEIKKVVAQIAVDQKNKIEETARKYLDEHAEELIEESIRNMIQASLADLKRRILGRGDK